MSSADEVARMLNFGGADSSALAEVISDYFDEADPDEEDNDFQDEDDEETTGEISPMCDEPSTPSSSVGTEPSPSSLSVGTEPSPSSSSVGTEPSLSSSSVDTKPSPSPLSAGTEPFISYSDSEPSTSSVGTESFTAVVGSVPYSSSAVGSEPSNAIVGSVPSPTSAMGTEPSTSTSTVGTSVFTDVNSVVAQATAVVCNGGLNFGAVVIDSDDSWDAEERRIARFVSGGCSCKLSDGGPCHKTFTPTESRALRDECRELTRDELDLAVMGQLRALCQRVVEGSAECNTCQLVGSQDGRVIIPSRDWAGFLSSHFRRLDGIKQYHHFRFERNHPGVVFFKKTAVAEEEERYLLRGVWTSSPVDKPPSITPQGLSLERPKYLYEKIREYCREDTRDLVCPDPATPTHQPPDTSSEETPPKRRRV